MPNDEAIETPQCSPAILNAVSPFNISHTPIIRRERVHEDEKKEAAGWLVSCWIKINCLTRNVGLRVECPPWE